MNTQKFADLRKKSEMTQLQVATALGISLRTVANWEGADPAKELSRPEAQAIYQLFAPKLLQPQIEKMCQEAFDEIPSEMVALWLVHNQDCLLMENTSRYHDFESKSKRDVPNPTCISRLVVESLTTFPLRTAEIINLAGENITKHPAKKYKSRAAFFFQDGICHSILHVPSFFPSARGPHPVLLLSLENRLDNDGKVIPGEAYDEKGKIVKGSEKDWIYTDPDEAKAKRLANQFRDRLLENMRMLDMIPDPS